MLVSAALASDAAESATTPKGHRHADSLVDIAPLAEAGICINDPDSRLGRRSRSRNGRSSSGSDHRHGAAERSVSRSMSRIHFHEEGEPMDPIRGDWDHIDRGRDRRPSSDGTALLQQHRAETAKAAAAAAAVSAAVSPTGTTFEPLTLRCTRRFASRANARGTIERTCLQLMATVTAVGWR